MFQNILEFNSSLVPYHSERGLKEGSKVPSAKVIKTGMLKLFYCGCFFFFFIYIYVL